MRRYSDKIAHNKILHVGVNKIKFSCRRHDNASRRQSLHGFTLVELLVVISIIAILLSILMPALGKVRKQARKTICMANMHNLNNTVIMYQNSYGVFPTAFWDDNSWKRELWWEPLIRAGIIAKDKINSTENPVGSGNWDLNIDKKAAQGYSCTEWSDFQKDHSLGSGYGMGIAYNWCLSPIVTNTGDSVNDKNPYYAGRIPKGTKIIFIDSPSTFYVEASWALFRPWWDATKYPTYGRVQYGSIAIWHSGAASSSWTDGHCESRAAKEYNPRMLTDVAPAAPTYETKKTPGM